MLTAEQKKQFSDILEELGRSLDITETQYDNAVKSYQYVGEWLSEGDSPLLPHRPEILPQGSFLLQTMIRPIAEDDELDIDIVCKLEKTQKDLTQYDLKHMVGDRLKANRTLLKLLELPDGRRCWTLQYAESSKFHLDVLPSVVVANYNAILEKALAAKELAETTRLGVRITDKTSPIYRTSTNLREWMKSNPFGYAIWFQNRCRTSVHEVRMMSEAIQPVPKFQKNKTPLQRVVQILKRHRDMWANGDEHKPISIIITTLAAKAYKKETEILDALVNVANSMEDYIEERYMPELGKSIKWIANPVNEEENFADKWIEVAQKQINFYNWIKQVKADIKSMTEKRSLQLIQESLEKPFGQSTITKAFSNYGENYLKARESGALKMAAGTGMLGSTGRTSVSQHTNFGANE